MRERDEHAHNLVGDGHYSNQLRGCGSADHLVRRRAPPGRHRGSGLQHLQVPYRQEDISELVGLQRVQEHTNGVMAGTALVHLGQLGWERDRDDLRSGAATEQAYQARSAGRPPPGSCVQALSCDELRNAGVQRARRVPDPGRRGRDWTLVL